MILSDPHTLRDFLHYYLFRGITCQVIFLRFLVFLNQKEKDQGFRINSMEGAFLSIFVPTEEEQ